MAKKVNKSEKELEAMRHSAEHVLTQAMIKLYPGLKMAMGPATEHGFYFDFDYDKQINEKDFPKIEKEMQKIIKKDLPFKKEVLEIKEARKLFKGNPYKQEWLDEIEERKEKAVIYRTGNEFVDLCGGPHVESTGKTGVFKLLSVAGAYWRGDEKNKMLTRIYGTAFKTKKDLDKYLQNLEEAKKRDYRIIGKKLELYAIYPEIGAGLPVWLPKGYRIRKDLEDYMINLERKYGYEHILTPHIGKETLFKTSGHLDFYKESMYAPIKIDKETYYLKPMNCPMAIIVYKSKPRSYRELPIKWGEFGTVYRYEKSGELSGLTRVRGFTQNDAHIFCTPEQLLDQFLEVFKMLKIFYQDLGFTNYKFRLGLGNPEKEKYKYCGTKERWRHAEKIIEKALKKTNSEYYKVVGEATFYGPKLDVQAVDSLGREESVSTIQIDFNLPEKFNMEYIDSKGKKKQPFLIHRALIGSFERFFAFLIEHYKGAFPLWLAPEQIWVIPIGAKHKKYAKSITKELAENNLRYQLKDENESVSKKIRNGEIQKIPYLLVVGDEEKKEKSVRVREKGKDLGEIKLTKFIEKAKIKIEKKIN